MIRRRNPAALPEPPITEDLTAFAHEVETAVRQLDAEYPNQALYRTLMNGARNHGSAFAQNLRLLAAALRKAGYP